MNVSNNSMATIILCSHLCVGENVAPLEPKEWGDLANSLIEKNIQPHELLNFTRDDFKNKLSLIDNQIDRLERLISRSASIAFELEKLSNIGIYLITRADSEYPKLLKRVLGKGCPPLFYCVGDIKLVDKKLVGFVGSRSVGEADIDFTKVIVKKVVEKGFGIVSGGAKGIDSIASEEAIKNGGFAVEFISDSLMRKIKNSTVINAIRNGQLLILSVSNPSAGFNAGFAMMRNKYIYANSIGTVVVKSDLNKGGTWSGAVENLKKNWTNEFCWDNKLYKGNLELMNKGAIPIDIDWDVNTDLKRKQVVNEPKQISLFD